MCQVSLLLKGHDLSWDKTTIYKTSHPHFNTESSQICLRKCASLVHSCTSALGLEKEEEECAIFILEFLPWFEALWRLVLELGFDFVTWRAFSLGSIFGGALRCEAWLWWWFGCFDWWHGGFAWLETWLMEALLRWWFGDNSCSTFYRQVGACHPWGLDSSNPSWLDPREH